MVFYVVRKGYKPGIYDTWNECSRQVIGYSGAIYKKFKLIEEARYYYDTGKEFENTGIITINGLNVQVRKKDKGREVDIELNEKKEKPREERKGCIEVWTDGSCINNGKKGSIGGVGVFFSNGDKRNISDKLHEKDLPHTNNKAELRAMSLALKQLLVMINSCNENSKEKEVIKNSMVRIYTDSEYVINCMLKWGMNWEKNEWKTAGGQRVKNVELIKRVLSRYRRCKKEYKSLNIRHINSHMREPKDKDSLEYRVWYGNYKADELARKGALNNV